MTGSQQLLTEYAQNGSEAAFRELVTRYLDLVYSVAIRLVEGDAHRAEDVAQTVFVDLARMARTLSKNVMPGGWLHRHTCFVAANTMRGERRRRSRERQAVEMNTLQEHPDTNPALIGPILDEAINKLGEADRTAILLRFFEQRDFRSVGEALGSNEDAARMRVTRALEKLHSLLKRRGVTTSAAALDAALAVGAVQAAPVGLAATISTAAALAGTTITATTTATIKTIAMTTLQKTLITATIVAAVGAGTYEARQASNLRDQVQTLQRERDAVAKQLAALSAKPTPHLPAPPMHATAQTKAVPTAAAPPADLQFTNLYARFKDKLPKLTAEQIEAYLKANGRTASSLLAAYRSSGDPALLQEARQKYPNDPRVAFEAATDKDLSPEQQRQWLTAFEQAAPNNALANYLSALNYFNSGQIDQGVQELAAAAGKPFQDYGPDSVEDDEEAYLSAGYSAAEAGKIATFQLPVPQLLEIKQLGQDMVDLANAYSQAGDQASAQAVLQMAVNLGQRYDASSSGEPVINQFVSLAVENMALSAMDPNNPYGGTGQTVQDRLNQLAQQKATLTELGQRTESLLETMSDQDWIIYIDRFSRLGEEAAEQWLVNKYGQQ